MLEISAFSLQAQSGGERLSGRTTMRFAKGSTAEAVGLHLRIRMYVG
jgi:hypothetical protein